MARGQRRERRQRRLITPRSSTSNRSSTSTERICSMSDNSVAVKVVQEFWETFGNKHDVEAAASFIDPDVLRRGPIPDPEEKDTCRGKDLYVTYLNHVMKVIPNYHVELFRIFGSDNGYVAMQGTERICLEPGSDQETINSVFGLFHVNDKGLIDPVDWYWKQPDPEILKWAAARNISAAGEAS